MQRTNNDNESNLSQLMDGEWHQLDKAGCVAALCEDEELRGKWSRYHLIRDAMRNEPVVADQSLAARICSALDDEPVYSNITALGGSVLHSAEQDDRRDDRRVEQAHRPESSVATQVTAIPDANTALSGSWVNTGVAGFALAASVALVTVVGLNMFEQTAPGGVSSVVAIDQGAQNAPVQSAAPGEVFAQDGNAVLPVVDFVSNDGAFWISPESSQRVGDEDRLNMMLSRHLEHSPTSAREGLLPYSRLVGYQQPALEEAPLETIDVER